MTTHTSHHQHAWRKEDEFLLFDAHSTVTCSRSSSSHAFTACQTDRQPPNSIVLQRQLSIAAENYALEQQANASAAATHNNSTSVLLTEPLANTPTPPLITAAPAIQILLTLIGWFVAAHLSRRRRDPMALLSAQQRQAKQFYRRPLPDSCTAFESQRGKRLFTDALAAGNANIYFRLAAQFVTQDEPAYCGISTLVMVLNALEVDPGRVWKGVWRWYDESMLDCCVSLDEARKTGITLRQFSCLAACNGLTISTVYADTQNDVTGYELFKRRLLASVQSDDRVLVVSYDRSCLGQTGTGHFSPLAAYDVESDMVLILDVARFKYPPHWVQLRTLWQAMKSIDAAAQRSRGYSTLRLSDEHRQRLQLLCVPDALMYGEGDGTLWQDVEAWQLWLGDDDALPHVEDDSDETLRLALQQCRQVFDNRLQMVNDSVSALLDCARCTPASDDVDCCEQMVKLGAHYRSAVGELTNLAGCQNDELSHMALVLAWPYRQPSDDGGDKDPTDAVDGQKSYSTKSQRIRQSVETAIASLSTELAAEVNRLRLQFRVALANRRQNTDALVSWLDAIDSAKH